MDERLRQTYDAFVQNNLITPDVVSFDMFSNSNEEQVKGLYQGALNKGLINRGY